MRRQSLQLVALAVVLGTLVPVSGARVAYHGDRDRVALTSWDGWALLRRAWRELELELPAALEHADHSTLRVVPVVAAISSRFGRRVHPITHRRQLHRGIDFAAPRGTPVLAAGAGTVVKAHRSGYYGRLVIIDHGDGVQTRYAHLSRIDVHAGDVVDAGDVLGTVGSTGRVTGPHLHFEVYRDGRAIDPLEALAPGTLTVLRVHAWLERRARQHERGNAS